MTTARLWSARSSTGHWTTVAVGHGSVDNQDCQPAPANDKSCHLRRQAVPKVIAWGRAQPTGGGGGSAQKIKKSTNAVDVECAAPELSVGIVTAVNLRFVRLGAIAERRGRAVAKPKWGRTTKRKPPHLQI